uniref:Uncharacterized protein n=1 Tax=Onchocerca volvulus TaxID=6282 RepID=A0A8R1U2I6_ONCVO
MLGKKDTSKALALFVPPAVSNCVSPLRSSINLLPEAFRKEQNYNYFIEKIFLKLLNPREIISKLPAPHDLELRDAKCESSRTFPNLEQANSSEDTDQYTASLTCSLVGMILMHLMYHELQDLL